MKYLGVESIAALPNFSRTADVPEGREVRAATSHVWTVLRVATATALALVLQVGSVAITKLPTFETTGARSSAEAPPRLNDFASAAARNLRLVTRTQPDESPPEAADPDYGF